MMLIRARNYAACSAPRTVAEAPVFAGGARSLDSLTFGSAVLRTAALPQRHRAVGAIPVFA
jgi:hypothetical protein